jgi:NAD+ synthase
MDKDIEDINKLINKINIDSEFIDLKPTFNQIKKSLNISNKQSISNIKPRLRMTSLYAIAQKHNYLVLGTDNKIEWEIGYFTKYGDGGVDLLPIVQLLKSDVKNIAKILNVPDSIINKQPSAGL